MTDNKADGIAMRVSLDCYLTVYPDDGEAPQDAALREIGPELDVGLAHALIKESDVVSVDPIEDL